MENCEYEEWKSSVVASNQQDKTKGIEAFLVFLLYTWAAKTVNLVFLTL